MLRSTPDCLKHLQRRCSGRRLERVGFYAECPVIANSLQSLENITIDLRLVHLRKAPGEICRTSADVHMRQVRSRLNDSGQGFPHNTHVVEIYNHPKIITLYAGDQADDILRIVEVLADSVIHSL